MAWAMLAKETTTAATADRINDGCILVVAERVPEVEMRTQRETNVIR